MKLGTKTGSRLALAGLLLASLLLAAPSQAETAANKAAAEALFQQGVELLRQGDYAAACKKLEDSQRVDPGVGTLLNLADCYEKSGRSASAWATFREAAALARTAGQSQRAELATERADKLETSLSRLAVLVSDETSSLEGLVVKRGSQQVPAAVLGSAIPVDPAVYTVRATAPGYLPFETEVEVPADGSSKSVTIPALAADPEAAAPVVETPPGEEAMSGQPSLAQGTGQGQRTAGIILGGVGLVGLGVGGILGVLAIDKKNQAFAPGPDACGPVSCPPGPGNDLIDQAFGFATASTVAFVAGGALLAAGAVVYFTAPKKMEPQVTRLELHPLAGGSVVTMGGTF